MAIYYLITSNIFVMVDEAAATRPDGLLVEAINQTLDLQQSVTVTSTTQHLRQTLNLQQSVSVNKTVHLHASNQLPFYNQGVRTKDYHVGNLLVFSQSAKKVLPHSVTSFLNLLQDLDITRGLTSTLVLQQSVRCNVVKMLSVISTFGIIQSTAAFLDATDFVGLDRPASIEDYNPNDLAIPPSPPAPLPVTFIGVHGSLTFKDVSYGDSDSVEHHRISRRTIGEQLIVFRDPNWGKTEILKFTLGNLTAAQGKAMLDFINQNLARQIRFHDWLGVRWLGVITNPETMLTQIGRDAGCSQFTLEIEFQGQQTQYETKLSASNQLVLTDGVSKI